MKKTVTIIALCLMAFGYLNAQTFPYGINYQAVARDANGNAQTNANVNLRFTIAPSTSTTTIVYQETQTAHTNSMGQFNAVIGTGTSAQTFSNVAWQGNTYNLIVEINPGSGYITIGNQPLQAVPYALATPIEKFAVYQEVYSTGTGPNDNALPASTWQSISLGTTATPSNTSDISVSGANITLNIGTYKITGYATYDIDGAQQYGANFLTQLYNTTNSTTVINGSGCYGGVVSGRVEITLQSQIQGFVTIATNGTVLNFQRMQIPYTCCGGSMTTEGISNQACNRVLSQLMIEKIQ
jgi:hypothetical protein